MSHVKLVQQQVEGGRQARHRAAGEMGGTLALRRAWFRIGLLAAGHTLADGYCVIVVPLLAYVATRLGISKEWAGGLYIAVATGASVSQIGWGYLCDRFGGRWILVLAPLVAGTVLTIGYSNNYWLIVAVILVAGTGTAAYHPVAGALAGQLMPSRRAVGVAWFLAAGMIGVALFPVAATQIVARWDLRNIWPLILPAPVLSFLLWRTFRDHNFSPHCSRRQQFTLREAFAGRVQPILLLFATAMFRAFPICAYQVTVPFMVQQQFGNVRMSGYILSLFSAGLGLGGIVGSSLERRFDQRRLLVVSLLACIPAVLAFSFASRYWLLPAAGLAGSLLGSTVPVAIAMGQQLSPRARRSSRR